MTTMSQGVVTTDDHGIILDVNQTLMDMIGYHEKKDFVGKNISVIMPRCVCVCACRLSPTL